MVRQTPLLCAIYAKKRSFYQDRLGTSTGNAALKKEMLFSQVFAPPHRTDRTCGSASTSPPMWKRRQRGPEACSPTRSIKL